MHNILRTFLTLLFFLIVANVCGQGKNNFAVFQVENFLNATAKTIVKKDTLKVNELIDLDFYRNQYFIPYYYPDRFIDHHFKNQMVTVWADSSGKKEHKNNWTNTFVYDQKSRVTVYSYSSCFICSQLPYTINILYDSYDRPIKLEMRNNDFRNTGKNDGDPTDVFLLTYDSSGNIIKLEQYEYGVLSKRISKI